MNVAVIPARGGSKRIPRKNVKPFCGQPMIAWSIQAALSSNCFDQIVVSTDDAEIAEVAQSLGADVPFLRPTELSDDHTGTTPVVAHAVQWLESHGKSVDAVCCIYATAPFLTPKDLQRGLDVLKRHSCDYSFAVTHYAFPIQRAIRIASDHRISMFQPEHFNTRSQDLEEAFHDAGQFYWGRPKAWTSGVPIFGPTSMPIILPCYRVQDIDTPEDWVRAEWMFQAMTTAHHP